MAMDYGEKRIGVAISDPLGIIAQPLDTVEISSQKDLVTKIKNLIEANKVGLLLVGNPLDHKGNPTRMSRQVNDFIAALRKECAVKIRLWDERFTSRLAVKTLHDRGIRVRKKRENIDAIAASIMLSEYLSANKL